MKKKTGMYSLATIILLASMTLFIGCSKDDSSNNSSGPPVGSNQETLTPAVGGNVSYESATVIVPPGSLQDTTAISVGIPSVAPSYTQPTNTAKVGNVYEFGPAGTTFNTPVTISLSYNPSDLGNNNANTLTILTYTDSTVTPVSLTNVIVNTTTHVVTGEAMHFSFFFLSITISGGGGGGDYPVPSGGNPMGVWNFSTVDYDMAGIFPDTIQYNIEVTGNGTLNIGETDWHADFVQNIHTTYAIKMYGQWFTYVDTTITVPTDTWGTYTSSGTHLFTTTTGSNTNPGEIGLVDTLTYTAETNRLIFYQTAEFEQYAIDVYEVFTK